MRKEKKSNEFVCGGRRGGGGGGGGRGREDVGALAHMHVYDNYTRIPLVRPSLVLPKSDLISGTVLILNVEHSSR